MSTVKVLAPGLALFLVLPLTRSGSGQEAPRPRGSESPPPGVPCNVSAREARCIVKLGFEELATLQGLTATASSAALGRRRAKCENDNPGVPGASETAVTTGTCEDINADTAARDVCRSAIQVVWDRCAATCRDYRKRNDEGEPAEIACRRDNRRSTTAAGPAARVAGGGTCTITCTASIVCVCDP